MRLVLDEFSYESFLPRLEARIGSDGSIGVHNANRANKAEQNGMEDDGSGDSVAEGSSEEEGE